MQFSRRIDAAAVLLRTTVGVMFVAHAALKYFVFTLPGTAKFFESLGLPGALGYVTFAAELIGGALLYVANGRSNSVSVIDTAAATRQSDIAVRELPWGVVIR